MRVVLTARADWRDPELRRDLFPSLEYELKKWHKGHLYGLIDADTYRELDENESPPERLLNDNHEYFVLGGSWNFWANSPRYPERCAIFENLYFPYDWNFKYLAVRNSAILWPRINLYLYTSLKNPSVVFLTSDRSPRRIIGKFVFGERNLRFTEFA